MNYRKVYDLIVEKYRDQKKIKFVTEEHHIIPRSLGGGDEKINLVHLPYREHFVCHQLLVKIHRHDKFAYNKMIHALWRMANGNQKINSLQYEISRKLFSEELSRRNLERFASGIHQFLDPQSHQKRISIMLENGTHPFLGGEIQRKNSTRIQRELVANGNHHWQDEAGSKSARELQLKRIANGTHHFLSEGIKKKHAERLASDLNPFAGEQGSKLSKDYWAKFTPEERSIILTKRAKKRWAKWRKEKNYPRPVMRNCYVSFRSRCVYELHWFMHIRH